MKQPTPMPTMKDVAKEAGVALGTVSKVINGIPVGESYRVKVEDAAKKLGYQVNNYARSLKTNKTYSVALVLPSVIHPYFALLAQEIGRALTVKGYRMTLFLTDFDPEAEQHCIQLMQQNKVDGAIGLTYNPNLVIAENLPYVSIDRYVNSNIPCIASDNFSGGRLAAEKLVELGCKKLAFIRTHSSVPGETDKRGQGFESYCVSNRIDYEMFQLVDAEEDDPRFEEYLRSHLKHGTLDIDGIFCGTDRMACCIKTMLRKLGVRVPEDVQIIGFDGIRKFGGPEPFCSSIAQPARAIAETCVDILLSEDRSKIPSLVYLPVSYAPGGTTKE